MESMHTDMLITRPPLMAYIVSSCKVPVFTSLEKVHNSFIPWTEQLEMKVCLRNVTYLLDVTLATHCHTHYHLTFKFKDLVANQHLTNYNLPINTNLAV